MNNRDDEHDLDAVFDELDNLPDGNDDDDDSGMEAPTIRIEFPADCAAYPGAQALVLTERDVLSMYALVAPVAEAEAVRIIRDTHYTYAEGSIVEELGLTHFPSPMSYEDRARARWRTAQLPKPQDLGREEFDFLDSREGEVDRLRRVHPEAFEKLDAVREEQHLRGEALDEEYYAFVSKTELNPTVMSDWGLSRRRELEIETQTLIADDQALREEYCEVIRLLVVPTV